MGITLDVLVSRKNSRPLASWPVTTVRTFIPCLFSSGLVHGHVSGISFSFLTSFVLFKSPSVNALFKSLKAISSHRRPLFG